VLVVAEKLIDDADADDDLLEVSIKAIKLFGTF